MSSEHFNKINDKQSDFLEIIKNKRFKRERVEKEFKEAKEKLNDHFEACDRYCEEKIRLADQSFELVENHMKKLEQEIALLEKEDAKDNGSQKSSKTKKIYNFYKKKNYENT